MTITPTTRLLPLFVYRSTLGDCTNGGASANAQSVYIPHPQGFIRAADVDPALIFTPENRGGDYWALIPHVTPQDGRTIGPMCGGNLATTSDSRGEGRIYHIHDRFETPADYALLSR